MRKRGRVDSNQEEVVAQLRQAGFSVQILSSVGGGCPDLLVGRNGINVLIEVKDGTKAPSARRLTLEEGDWHAFWRGQICVAQSAERAVEMAIEATK